ncbi:MAG: DUF928 domain-containing protein [Spirulinaceae cyanobacterium]
MFHPRTTLISAICLAIAMSLGGAARAMPKPESSSAFAPPDLGAPDTTSDGGTRGEVFFTPTDRGAPETTGDGGTRGEILFTPTDRGAPETTGDGGTRRGHDLAVLPRTLQLLVPSATLPLTLDEQPEFFAYVPAAPAQAVKFTLYRHDSSTKTDEQLVHEVEIPMPDESGIVRFTLPAHSQAILEPDQLYHWYVSLVMDTEDASANVVADSWIQRVSPGSAYAQRFATLSQDLSSASAYAQAGLWYEAFAAQLQARQLGTTAFVPQACAQNTAQDDWSTFLQSVQLCDVGAAPLLN